MKFEAQKDELERAMARIDAIVPGRDMQTLLSNVLLTIEKEQVNITASDMESTVRIQIGAQNTKSGELIVRAKKLSEIAKQLISENIVFEAEDSGAEDGDDEAPSYLVKLEGTGSQAAKFKMAGSDRSHFPNLAHIPKESLSQLSSDTLAEMINKTFFSISQEDNRYIYNGLCFHADGNKLTLIGTDGRRLAAVTREMPNPIALGNDETGDIVVHAKAIRELLRIIDADAEIHIGVEQRDIFFQVGDAELSSRLLEGKFPDYNKVIPKTSTIQIQVDREALLNSLRQVMVMTEPPSFQIRMTVTSGALQLKANTPEVGEAEISLPIDYSGDPLEIGFNSTYFTDILRNLSCKSLRLEFNDSTKPVVIHDLEDENYIALVMPMKI